MRKKQMHKNCAKSCSFQISQNEIAYQITQIRGYNIYLYVSQLYDKTTKFSQQN